ncbi:UPF0722 protein [Lingula anatina]|uniref:Cilia- and flagella-associated protein HOATZ n=1 Tax=Lingula anatina TaxID=7574 RepID=A0A1S3IAX0_LINAN|nr:UPF0722 protein [Lingula anatina]|eukprot:XP_013394554.1 UPF0722 protein [Lingula anatina]
MATVVVELPKSNEKTEFSGSSEEDKAYAKSFWQSIQLHPPIESRLVSSDIRQRLKRAPPGGQPINLAHHPEAEPPQLTSFLLTSHALERADAYHKLQQKAAFREDAIMLLQKQREDRIMKEKVSDHKGIKKPKPEPVPIDSDEEKEMELDIEATMRELDKYDKSVTVDSD